MKPKIKKNIEIIRCDVCKKDVTDKHHYGSFEGEIWCPKCYEKRTKTTKP